MGNVVSIEESIGLETLTCANCGVYFAAPVRIIEQRRSVGGDFYCPNGHRLVFKETELNRLKAEVEQAKAKIFSVTKQKEWAEQSEKKARDELQRVRTRVSNGVCPCCKRSFVNLQRHMKSKHPEVLR